MSATTLRGSSIGCARPLELGTGRDNLERGEKARKETARNNACDCHLDGACPRVPRRLGGDSQRVAGSLSIVRGTF